MAAENAVLSQREIDALLNADLSEVEEEDLAAITQQAKPDTGRRIKPYDFRHPEKLSKEQIRGLQIIQHGVAGAMAQALSARLRAQVEAKLSALERSIYDEYTGQVGQDAVIVIIDMAPLQGYCVASFGIDVAFSIIDRLLGGRGKVSKSATQRDLTDIEVALVRHIGGDIASSMVEPWTRIADLTPEVTELAVGPQVVHVVPPSEFVITAWYEFRFAEQTGDISICIPLTILEQILPKLSGQTLFDNRPRPGDREGQQIREDQVQPARVGIRAVLGDARIPAAELSSLQPGDVLVLDTRVEDPLRVYVGNIERFAASAGTRGKHIAAQITGLVNGDGVVVPFDEDIHG